MNPVTQRASVLKPVFSKPLQAKKANSKPLVDSPKITNEMLPPMVFDQISPDETMIFTDMTKTLLFPQENGLPEKVRDRFQELLEKKAHIVVVTSDTKDIVQKYLIDHLDLKPHHKLVVICGSGYQIFKNNGNGLENIYTGRPILSQDREFFIDKVESLIKEYDPQFQIPIDHRKQLLSPDGIRKENYEVGNKKNVRFNIEVSPGKITIFFQHLPNRDRAIIKNVLSKIDAEPRLQAMKKKYGFFSATEPDCYELTTSSKDKGIDTYCQLLKEDIRKHMQNVLVFGDSQNDLGLFQYPYLSSIWVDQNVAQMQKKMKILKFFVGKNEKFFQDHINRTDPRSAFFLKGQYMNGTAKVMKMVLRQNNPPPFRPHTVMKQVK